MKRTLFFLLAAILPILAHNANAQIFEPITWTQWVDMKSSTEGNLVFKAKIADGWHLYNTQLPDDGPNPTEVQLNAVDGVEFVGHLQPSQSPIEKYDEIFALNLSWWEGSVTLSQAFRITDGHAHEITGRIYFQGCNDQSCIPPQKVPFSLTVGKDLEAAPVVEETADTVVAVPAPVVVAQEEPADLWQPVTFVEETQEASVSESPWWVIFLWGFGGGLLALLTPCVWPMIPMTVSFFLKKSNSKGRSVLDAVIYGISIIVIYLILGLAITILFGASKLNELSTNAIFNIAFFLLLVVFAISFFGAFDIKLPSKWANSVDGKAERTTGLISIFFMAFTLVLVSFSCTGPIIGTLLVEAASMGNIVGPAVGMAGFAIALALPFSLFAIFPTWLKEMPRSGGWLNSVKVVLGFLELALSLKFLSVADLAYGWGILDREVFVSLWVVIFALLGMYLLGKLRFSHDSPLDYVSIPRFFMAMASFSFAIYLIPGLWGAPLKSVSAFVPPLYTQDFNLYAGGHFEEFDDYDRGMAYAAEAGRPVLIDFSGYGCVNCRKMEGKVFDTEIVSQIIKENFILIKLMVDDKTPLEQPVTVDENGKKVLLETIGDKWSYLQRFKFGANSQPYYIMLNGRGEALSGPAYYDENVAKFAEWLNAGIKAYSEAN